jgi:ribulose-phosphate 3-epimerase
MNIHLSASMMCANYANLEHEVRNLENAGIDSFHIDLMDGRFVDNFGMGYQDMEYIRKATYTPLEAHLMLEDPHDYFGMLLPMGFDAIYIHPEAERNTAGALEKIDKAGIIPGIAINPGTSIEQVRELLHTARRVMVLCINPGHAGRTHLPYVDDKIKRLVDIKDKYCFEVFIDGSCTDERISFFSEMGVEGYVLGTATLFGEDKPDYRTTVQKLRAQCGKELK